MANPLNILLIQIRRRDDPMAAHEATCVARRLGTRSVALTTANAFETLAETQWLAGVDGVIIGGSGAFSVHHPLSRRWVPALRVLLEEMLVRQVPGFGVCFGHQLLGHHLGAEVATIPEHAEVGTVTVSLTAQGQADPVFGPVGAQLEVHTGHSDSVMSVPGGVVLLAENGALKSQAFRVRDAPFYSTQFHPDITGAEARERYRAYQASLATDVPNATEEKLERYRPGQDASTALIGHFVDEIVATQ